MSDEKDLRNQIEALLFSSGRAMSVEDLSSVVELEKRYVKKSLVALKEWYDSLDGGLMVIEEGDLWKLSIKEKYVSMVTKIVSDTELSKTVLETLSVIAWKSPVLQSEVIKIRTTNAYDHIKELVDAGFVTKEKEGRSYKLKISEKFYEYFDVPGDKGIKAAFEEVKIPEKKEPEEIKKVGDMDVVPVDDNSVEHGKTAQIFGTDQPPKPEGDEEELAPQPSPIDDVEDPKSKIPPIDDDFLDRLDEQIGKMTKKNDDLDNDELFKRTPEAESSEDTSASEDKPLSESESDESESSELVDEDIDETEDSEETSDEKVVDEYEESTKLEKKSEEEPVDGENEEKDESSDEDDKDVETPEDENAENELDDESTGKLSEELEESEKELDSEIEDDVEEEDKKKEDASS